MMDKEQISIHAPAKGATFSAYRCIPSKWNFNPRSREGSDINNCHFFHILSISIHAPAKGATPT